MVKPWAFGESLISNSGSVTHSFVTLPSANSLSPLSRSVKGRRCHYLPQRVTVKMSFFLSNVSKYTVISTKKLKLWKMLARMVGSYELEKEYSISLLSRQSTQWSYDSFQGSLSLYTSCMEQRMLLIHSMSTCYSFC